MPRGLGKVQVEILDSLDAAMANAQEYRGGGQELGWINHMGLDVKLHPSVYDLRAVQHYLAEKQGKLVDGQVDKNYQETFSSSVRGLVRRGAIEPLWLVPVVDWQLGHEEQLLQLNKDRYLWVSERQRRFVRKKDFRIFASRSQRTKLFNRRSEHEYQRIE